MTGGDKPMRADAQRNRELLLAAAVAAFSRNGPEVTLESIAKDAGVGIGTLYRHFPSREALVDAAYRSELARLCDSVPELLDAMSADKALRTWMDLFLEYMTTKRGMSDALRMVIASGGNPFAESRGRLLAAFTALHASGRRRRHAARRPRSGGPDGQRQRRVPRRGGARPARAGRASPGSADGWPALRRGGRTPWLAGTGTAGFAASSVTGTGAGSEPPGLLAFVTGGPVLLQRRTWWSHHGGTWGLPGGARDSHESALAGALREAAEECGVPPDAVRPRGVFTDDHGGWSYTTVLAEAREAVCRAVSDDDETDEVAWVPSAGGRSGSTCIRASPRTGRELRRELSPVTIIVDGANVVGSRPDGWWRDRAGAAARLRDQLAPLVTQGITELPADLMPVAGGGRPARCRRTRPARSRRGRADLDAMAAGCRPGRRRRGPSRGGRAQRQPGAHRRGAGLRRRHDRRAWPRRPPGGASSSRPTGSCGSDASRRGAAVAGPGWLLALR